MRTYRFAWADQSRFIEAKTIGQAVAAFLSNYGEGLGLANSLIVEEV